MLVERADHLVVGAVVWCTPQHGEEGGCDVSNPVVLDDWEASLMAYHGMADGEL